MAEYEKIVKKILKENGYWYKRNTRGSHEMWTNDIYSVVVPYEVSKNLANVIMKEAHIDKRW
jgi:predicted RNA binding protein YcfA (HicA-like mRNA interferase family)